MTHNMKRIYQIPATVLLLLFLINNYRAEGYFIENKGQFLVDGEPSEALFFADIPAGRIFVYKDSLELIYRKFSTDGAVMPGKASVIFPVLENELTRFTAVETGYYENFYFPHCSEGITARGFEKVLLEIPVADEAVELGLVNGTIQLTIKSASAGSSKGQTSEIEIRGIAEEEISRFCLPGDNFDLEIISIDLSDAVNIAEKKEAPQASDEYDLDFSTYFGGGGDEMSQSKGLLVDSDGSIIFSGGTKSQNGGNIIAASGAYQSELDGIRDAFIVKFDSEGKRLWSTYFGGEKWDFTRDCALDSKSNIYVTGFTGSSNAVATDGAFQQTLGGGDDAFVAKFDSDGRLQWSTYFGGAGNEHVHGIEVDNRNDALYICGRTLSGSGIASPGAYKTALGGEADGYFAKFDLDGGRIWSTYYGGSDYDQSKAIAIDSSGNVYLIGATESHDGIATTGAFQNEHSSFLDSYIAKFSPAGTRIWGTYYGGSEEEHPQNILYCPDGNVAVVGETYSSDRISFGDSYQSSKAGDSDAFLAKFTTSGVGLWGTYFGGGAYETAPDLFVDPNGDLYFAGATESAEGIASSSAFKTDRAGSRCAYFAKFSSVGEKLYGTYFGGGGEDKAVGIAGSSDFVAIAGYTKSGSGIATAGAHQTNCGGGYDAYVAKFSAPILLEAPNLISPDNDAELDLGEILLKWREVEGAHSYEVMISSDSEFNSLEVSEIVTETIYRFIPENPGDYFWKVSARSGSIESDFSETHSFEIVEDLVLSAPILVAPTEAAEIFDVDVILIWESVHKAEEYELIVAEDKDFNSMSLQTTIADTSYDFELSLGVYYWKVRAISGDVSSAFSEIREFELTIEAPETPTLTYPANGATNVPGDLTFRWSATARADSVRLTLTDDKDELVEERTFESGTTSYFYSGLPETSKFSWKITALNYGGTTESENAEFWTEDPNSFFETGLDKSVYLFPNPTRDVLTVKIPDDFEKIPYIEIYDRFGRLRITKKLAYAIVDIDLSDLQSGVYYLSAGSDISIFTVIR